MVVILLALVAVMGVSWGPVGHEAGGDVGVLEQND